MLIYRNFFFVIVSLMSTNFGLPISFKDLVETETNESETELTTKSDVLILAEESIAKHTTKPNDGLILTEETVIEHTIKPEVLISTEETVIEHTIKPEVLISTEETTVEHKTQTDVLISTKETSMEHTTQPNVLISTEENTIVTQPYQNPIYENFFIQNGYLNTTCYYNSGNDDSFEHDKSVCFSQAVKDFQTHLGLEVTGEINPETRRFILNPRCGVSDKFIGMNSMRKRNYLIHDTTWTNSTVTWFVDGRNNNGILPSEVREIMQKSFQKWADVTNLNFIEVSNSDSADIRISFQKSSHNVGQTDQDFSKEVYAHAFYPRTNQEPLDGDCHFNDDKKFSTGNYSVAHSSGKISLFLIAIHEIGHSLGLGHSHIQGTIMYENYEQMHHVDDLTHYDIDGIQKIYGGKVLPATNDSIMATTVRPKVVCPTTVDASVQISEGNIKKTLVFNKENYYVLNSDDFGIAEGPFSVSSKFEGVPYVDAVFTRGDKFHFFFYGDSYSVFKNYSLDIAPRKISDGFKNLDTSFRDVDAALSIDCHVFLFKGDYYWKYTLELSSMQYKFDYERKISTHWKGLPSSINGAFKWHDVHEHRKIYFFKGSEYYRVNVENFEVDYGYPMKLSDSFLKCTSKSSKRLFSSYILFTSVLLTVWSFM
ncbi:matrix metalloproteinase-19 isoform X3 [Hydra vulgaris]|uniref:matrix metalloproteinase-19 isoform X3 n=1 Tax=Hydra vulgaris TaxID=6087 RepID=UPI001F5FB3B5|nr:matrix metalloproteinase-19 isoform X3 [Hydra vulgaris]